MVTSRLKRLVTVVTGQGDRQRGWKIMADWEKITPTHYCNECGKVIGQLRGTWRTILGNLCKMGADGVHIPGRTYVKAA